MTPHLRVMTALLLLAAVTTTRATAATVTELPGLPIPPATNPPYSATWRPVHINASGNVVGTVVFSRKPCPRCAAVVVRRSFQVVNGITTQVGPDDYIAVTSNDADDIAFNWYDPWITGANWAFLYHDGVMTPLDTIPHVVVDLTNLGQVSYGPFINDHGVIASMASDNEHGNHAFKYAAGVPMLDLNCSAPSPEFECMTGYDTGFDRLHDLNDGATVADAMAVGEDRGNPWSSSIGPQAAFVGWQGHTTYLSSGYTAAALAVNDHGLIVGYDDGQAVLWAPTGFGEWTEHTVASLANDPSWTFSQATSVNDAGEVVGVGTHNGVAAMFRLSGGLVAAEAPRAGAGLRLGASPNPARGAVHFRGVTPGGVDGTARIAVLDLAGRRVTSLEAPIVNGTFDAGWDGRAANGDALRAGMYFARIEVAGQVARTTVMLAR